MFCFCFFSLGEENQSRDSLDGDLLVSKGLSLPKLLFPGLQESAEHFPTLLPSTATPLLGAIHPLSNTQQNPRIAQSKGWSQEASIRRAFAEPYE